MIKGIKTNKYGRALILFLALMVVFTVISRAADSVTVARVSAESLKRGMLSHKASAQGTIKAAEVEYVAGVKDFRITRIHVGVGNRVEVGDLLFTLNGDEIREKMDELQSDLAAMNIELKKLKMDQDGSSSAQSAVDTAKQELERAQADSDFNQMLNDGKQLLQDQRAVEDAQKKLEEAQASLKETQSRGGLDLELKQLDIQNKQKELSKLKKLLENDGVIKAEISGTIGEIFITQGTVSSGEDLCTIVPDDAPLEFEGKMTAEEAEFVKAGDTVSVTLAGRNTPVSRELTIKSLVKEGDVVTVTVDLSQERNLQLNASAKMDHLQKTQEYSTMVSIAALRGSEDEYYVLVLREKNTVLGTQLVAERVGVELIDKDSVNAAVEGALTRSDKIIVGSSKMISEGDRVREEQ